MTPNDHNAARRKRNMKRLLYIVAGVIAQTAIIVLLVMLVMRIRSPKVRLRAVTVEGLTTNTSSPSFIMKLNAQVTVKNTNFGHFKFQNSTARVTYRGSLVGEATIVKARAGAWSTKKLNVTVTTSSSKVSRNSQLSNDIKAGIIPLSSHAKLEGKVKLFNIFKKKKSTEMNCTMEVNTTTQEIRNLKCK